MRRGSSAAEGLRRATHGTATSTSRGNGQPDAHQRAHGREHARLAKSSGGLTSKRQMRIDKKARQPLPASAHAAAGTRRRRRSSCFSPNGSAGGAQTERVRGADLTAAPSLSARRGWDEAATQVELLSTKRRGGWGANGARHPHSTAASPFSHAAADCSCARQSKGRAHRRRHEEGVPVTLPHRTHARPKRAPSWRCLRGGGCDALLRREVTFSPLKQQQRRHPPSEQPKGPRLD